MKIAYKFYFIITHKCKVQQVKKKIKMDETVKVLDSMNNLWK